MPRYGSYFSGPWAGFCGGSGNRFDTRRDSGPNELGPRETGRSAASWPIASAAVSRTATEKRTRAVSRSRRPAQWGARALSWAHMWRTLRVGMLVGCVAVGLAAQADAGDRAQASGPRWDLDHMFWRLRTLQWIWHAPEEGERCIQFSSYDRRSDAGPKRVGAWYANRDRGHYLREVDGASGKEYVMVDVRGPGCLARLWSANPEARCTSMSTASGSGAWTLASCAPGEPGCPSRSRRCVHGAATSTCRSCSKNGWSCRQRPKTSTTWQM